VTGVQTCALPISPKPQNPNERDVSVNNRMCTQSSIKFTTHDD